MNNDMEIPRQKTGVKLPGIVVALGLASFFTDMSSEMIYPLLPVFLTTVLGASAVSLGIIEGIAETTASFLKLLSGIWSDRVSRRKPFILAGYGIAGMARPLIGLAAGWPFVLAMRFVDRVGKGLRTSPRDALIAESVPPERRGAAFGFQRAMDHAGAVAGPLTATALLLLFGLPLRTVFLLAFIPAAAVIAVLLLGVRENAKAAPVSDKQPLLGHWHELGTPAHVYLLAILVFTLGNSTDAFLFLRLTEAGMPVYGISLVWAAHHVIKMVSSYAGGGLSDRVGRKRLVLWGWFLYGLVYLAFAFFDTLTPMVILFLIYGLYFGLTEPVERAWMVDMAPKNCVGSALGYYHGTVGLGALPASVLFGWIWKMFGSSTAFAMGSALALAAAVILTRVKDPQHDAIPK